MVATTAGGQREPEGEPDERVGPVRRNPLTYPRLTLAELNGTRYPDVDLSAFSNYERMAILSECLDARMEEAVVNNDYETYERLGMQRNHVEGLRLAASDVRPGEG